MHFYIKFLKHNTLSIMLTSKFLEWDMHTCKWKRKGRKDYVIYIFTYANNNWDTWRQVKQDQGHHYPQIGAQWH